MIATDAKIELTVHDRCDAHASGVAQACVRVLVSHDGHKQPLYLDFCYHCFNLLEATMLSVGSTVVTDYRKALDEAEKSLA